MNLRPNHFPGERLRWPVPSPEKKKIPREGVLNDFRASPSNCKHQNPNAASESAESLKRLPGNVARRQACRNVKQTSKLLFCDGTKKNKKETATSKSSAKLAETKKRKEIMLAYAASDREDVNAQCLVRRAYTKGNAFCCSVSR